jgi:hypothetical protein
MGKIDIQSLTVVTPSSNDYIIISDVSDAGKAKKALFTNCGLSSNTPFFQTRLVTLASIGTWYPITFPDAFTLIPRVLVTSEYGGDAYYRNITTTGCELYQLSNIRPITVLAIEQND